MSLVQWFPGIGGGSGRHDYESASSAASPLDKIKSDASYDTFTWKIINLIEKNKIPKLDYKNEFINHEVHVNTQEPYPYIDNIKHEDMPENIMYVIIPDERLLVAFKMRESDSIDGKIHVALLMQRLSWTSNYWVSSGDLKLFSGDIDNKNLPEIEKLFQKQPIQGDTKKSYKVIS